MADIKIDRMRLKEWIELNAAKIAETANIDINIVKVESMAGVTSFIATADIEYREIPLEAVEAK